MVNAGYMKLNNTSDADITLHYITSPVYDAVQIHTTIQKMALLRWCTQKPCDSANGSVALEPRSSFNTTGPRRNIQEGMN